MQRMLMALVLAWAGVVQAAGTVPFASSSTVLRFGIPWWYGYCDWRPGYFEPDCAPPRAFNSRIEAADRWAADASAARYENCPSWTRISGEDGYSDAGIRCNVAPNVGLPRWSGFARYDVSVTTCPANSTRNSSNSACTCTAGHQPDATGTACVAVAVDCDGCSAGNPVQPGSGRKLHEETDYAGAGAAPLELRRLYRSSWGDGLPAAGLAPRPAWGGGWRFSLHARLALLPSGEVRAVRPDGRIVVFRPQGTAAAGTPATWAAQAGSADTLSELLDAAGQRSGFVLKVFADDSTEQYDASGRLLALSARHGWTTTVLYDAGGRLAGVRNAFGRQLEFGYDAAGRIATMVAPGGEVTRYDYDGAGNLASVTWPDGHLRRYHYEDARHPDALGRRLRERAHDGSVSFFAYDTKGREVERAVFPAAYAEATTRPPLSAATSVTSTRWHASWNLPSQLAEPGRFSAFSYSAKGLLTGSSWTATTDGTGAQKFSATRTGGTFATGYSYSAAGLVTTVVERETPLGGTALERQRWTMAYNASGDLTRIADVTGGNLVGRASAYDAHGRLTAGTSMSDVTLRLTYSPRGAVQSMAEGGQTTTFAIDSAGRTTRVGLPGGRQLTYEHDAAHRLLDVKLDGRSLNDSGSVTPASPGSSIRSPFSRTLKALEVGLLSVIPSVRAQVLPLLPRPLPPPLPGQDAPGQPAMDPRTILMQTDGARSPTTDTFVRRLAAALRDMCECDPEGYDRPTLSFLSVSKMIAAGHVPAVMGVTIPGKSSFAPEVSPNQELVDEVVRRGYRSVSARTGNVEYYVSTMGRTMGIAFGRPTTAIRLVVAPDCPPKGRPCKRNEVVSFFPDSEGKSQ